MKRQSLIKGTIVLGTAGILAKFLGLFFRWPLQMLIGDLGMGYYQTSYPIYMFFIAVASGIPVAVSKMVSEKNALGDREGAVQVLRKAMLLMLCMGSTFTVLMLLFSRQLIEFLSWNDKSYYALMGIAIAPIFISIMGALRGFFQGLQNMNYTAVSQVLEQIGRVVIGVGLAFVLLPMGIEYAAGGAAIGAAAGGILGGSYLIVKYFIVKREFLIKKVKNDSEILNSLLYIAVPISLGAAVGSIMALIDSVLVQQKLLLAGFSMTEVTILYGQLTGKAFVLINVPLTLSMALCASIVPAIAEAHVLHNNREVINRVQLAIRLSSTIALPSVLGLFFMASPILNLIFPGQAQGFEILKYLSITIPFIILAQITTAILQGVGKYMAPVINLSIGCIVKVIITLILVPMPNINVYGAVIGSIAGYAIISILNISLLKRTLRTKISYYDAIVKPGYASLIMITAVVFLYKYVYNYTMSNGIACVLSISIGILIYGVFIFIFGIFDYGYFKRKILRK
jgi:stage V sporulation protein B